MEKMELQKGTSHLSFLEASGQEEPHSLSSQLLSPAASPPPMRSAPPYKSPSPPLSFVFCQLCLSALVLACDTILGSACDSVEGHPSSVSKALGVMLSSPTWKKTKPTILR